MGRQRSCSTRSRPYHFNTGGRGTKRKSGVQHRAGRPRPNRDPRGVSASHKQAGSIRSADLGCQGASAAFIWMSVKDSFSLQATSLSVPRPCQRQGRGLQVTGCLFAWPQGQSRSVESSAAEVCHQKPGKINNFPQRVHITKVDCVARKLPPLSKI